MIVVDRVLTRLAHAPGAVVLQELCQGTARPITGAELSRLVSAARSALQAAGVNAGDRVALVGNNSAQWIALTLALHAERAVLVPLHPRRTHAELVDILDDCQPRVVFAEDPALAQSLTAQGRLTSSLDAAFSTSHEPRATSDESRATTHESRATSAVAIIYTSGTSGRPKGAVLLADAVDHIVRCASERLDSLMTGHHGDERVLHYLPFCFAGSWILLLTCLSRSAVLSLNTDVSALFYDLRAVRPHYFLNVPLVLERIRARVEKQIADRSRSMWRLYVRVSAASRARYANKNTLADRLTLAIADRLLFRRIRSTLAPDLRGLICGSALLSEDTARTFDMWGVPVYQVYGLTETTAICTIDVKGATVPGRVGHAVDGVEMKTADTGEILVRGRNLFAGYWGEDARARLTSDGWLRTGDLGNVDAHGNWRIHGRVDDVIVLASGHKVMPTRVEQALARHLTADHIVVVPDGTGHLCAVLVGRITEADAERALESSRLELSPHEAVRAYRIHPGPFTIDNGFLTANGKIRRDQVRLWLARSDA